MSSLPGQYGPSAPVVTCPICSAPNLSGTMFCDHCGAALGGTTPAAAVSMPPAPSASAPSFTVGIWGTRGAGKTMYLYMLQDHIIQTRSPDWHMGAENDAARDFMNRAARTFGKRRYPPPTEIKDNTPVELLFKFVNRVQKGSDKEYTMRVLDMPGEWYEQPDSPPKRAATLMQYFSDCKGLLCLVDPDKDEKEPMMVYLRTLLNDLWFQTKQPIDKRLAFCLTKMDKPQHRRFRQTPGAYIRQKLGEPLVKAIEAYCVAGKVSFDFACSAVGYYPGIKPDRSNSGVDWQGAGIIYSANIQPFGLFEPLEKWLFLD